MDEKHKDIRINKPTRLGEIAGAGHAGPINRWINKLGLQENLTKAKLAADLGSGLGESVVILRGLCPNAEIHTIDSFYSDIDVNSKKKIGGKQQHYERNLHEYSRGLVREGRSLDAALLIAVPDHQLDKEDGYRVLSEAVKTGGVVIESGDTKLDVLSMRKYFEDLYFDEDPLNQRAVWQRK